jgi:hypothetical protein
MTMSYPADFNNQRRDLRVRTELLAQISIGSQLTLNGQLKDLSLKSAFIRLKHSIYMQLNDEVGFMIQTIPGNNEQVIKGLARISRIAAGEGVAVYFTKLDDASSAVLKQFVKEPESGAMER